MRREADVLLVAASRMGNLDLPYDQYWGDPSGQRRSDRHRRAPSRRQPAPHPRHPVRREHRADGHRGPSAGDGPAGRRREGLARHRALDQETRLAQAAPVLQWRGRDPSRARSAPSAPSSVPMPSTPSTAETRHCGRTPSCRPPSRTPTTRSSSSACSVPASPPRSAQSSAPPSARSSASPATVPRASTSWRCSRPPARTWRSRPSSSPRARGPWRSPTSQPLRRDVRHRAGRDPLGPRRAGSRLPQRIRRPHRGPQSRASAGSGHDGPSLVCLRTDHDANLAVPEDMLARFFEVYSGPAAP